MLWGSRTQPAELWLDLPEHGPLDPLAERLELLQRQSLNRDPLRPVLRLLRVAPPPPAAAALPPAAPSISPQRLLLLLLVLVLRPSVPPRRSGTPPTHSGLDPDLGRDNNC